jgi:hypothetical protein
MSFTRKIRRAAHKIRVKPLPVKRAGVALNMAGKLVMRKKIIGSNHMPPKAKR